jgi:hypothetical protein
MVGEPGKGKGKRGAAEEVVEFWFIFFLFRDDACWCCLWRGRSRSCCIPRWRIVAVRRDIRRISWLCCVLMAWLLGLSKGGRGRFE